MPNRRILIVDDEADLMWLLKLNLECAAGYEALECRRGAQALALARDFRPEVVLLDVMLPDMDAGQVAAELQGDPDLGRPVVVFMTDSSPRVAEPDAMAEHQTRIAKSACLSELIERIELLAGARELARACRAVRDGLEARGVLARERVA